MIILLYNFVHFPPSTSLLDAVDFLVSTLCGMQTEILNLFSIFHNMAAVVPSSSVAENNDDTDSTENTDDSLLAYLSAGCHKDFWMVQG